MQIKKIAAIFMVGALAMAGCKNKDKKEEQTSHEVTAVLAGATAQTGEANDTIVAHFSGDTEDLDSQLAGSSITASFTGDEWISPEVNFNSNAIEFIGNVVATDNILTWFAYNLPDFFEVKDMMQSYTWVTGIASTVGMFLGNVIGGDDGLLPREFLDAYVLGVADFCGLEFSLSNRNCEEPDSEDAEFCQYYNKGMAFADGNCEFLGSGSSLAYEEGALDNCKGNCDVDSYLPDIENAGAIGYYITYVYQCATPQTECNDYGQIQGNEDLCADNCGYCAQGTPYCEGYNEACQRSPEEYCQQQVDPIYDDGVRSGRLACQSRQPFDNNCLAHNVEAFCAGYEVGYLEGGCSKDDDDDDDDDDNDDDENFIESLIGFLSKMPVDSVKDLARAVLAFTGSNFNGFVLSDSEALLTDHLVSTLMYVLGELNTDKLKGDKAVLYYNLGQLLFSLQLHDGYIGYDNRFLANVEERADVIRAGATYAITMDGNFSCQERVDINGIYDLIDHMNVAGFVIGDLESLINLAAPNDINDGCLAETRDILQAWLDAELGRGVAKIPEGGVSTSVLNFLEKTNIIITLAEDLQLSKDEAVSLKDVKNDYLANLLASIDMDISKPLPAKTLKMPASLIKDFAGRPNRAYSFKLSNMLAYQGVLDNLLSKVDMTGMKITPEALPFDQVFQPATADDDDDDPSPVIIGLGTEVIADSKLAAGEVFAICFTEGSVLDNASCNRVSYYLQSAGLPLACTGVQHTALRGSNVVFRNNELTGNCLNIEALAASDLPLNISIPAGAVQTIFGVANSEPANYVIDDVILPKVMQIGYELRQADVVRTGLIAGDMITIVFNTAIDVASLAKTLQAAVGNDMSIAPLSNTIRITLSKSFADGETVLTIPAAAVSDIVPAPAVSHNMAADYLLKVNMAEIRANYLRDNNSIFIISDASYHVKDTLNYGDNFYVELLDSENNSYWMTLLASSVKHPENIESNCDPEDIFQFRYSVNKRYNGVEIKLNNSCEVKLAAGAEAIVLRPLDYMDENGIDTTYGFDLSNFTITLSRDEINKFIKGRDSIFKKDYTASATYKYSPFSQCGNGLLHDYDIIDIDLGANGPFLMENISYDQFIEELTGKLGLSDSAVDCDMVGTATGAGFHCTLMDSMTDAPTAEQTIEMALTDDNAGGKVTIKLPLPNTYTVKAYTSNGDKHDGKLVKGEQVVVEASCASNSLTGALEILVNDKIKDLHLVATDNDSYDHRHRWIFAYNGQEALDLSNAITVDIPALYEKNGAKLAKQTITITEKAVSDVVFEYVAGSADGNSAIFKASSPVANGSYALSANGFESEAGLGEVLFSKDEANADNDNLFYIRQLLSELINLDAVQDLIQDLID